jgi:SAM-dependent methyltransferase
MEGRVLRVIDEPEAEKLETFLKTAAARQFVSKNQLVSTRRLDQNEAAAVRGAPEWHCLFEDRPGAVVFEHERIPFRSYPYEWCPEMLWEAGRLTLELAQKSLAEGYGLKDATPYNVLFRGAQAVFIDVPSFELRAAGDPIWKAYSQFVRTFLLPLLVNERWGVPLADVFRTRRDGLEPHEVYRFCGPFERFRPLVFSLVSMPTWLSGKARKKGTKLYQNRTLANAEKARFILESLLKRLQRSLEATKPHARQNSLWTRYMETNSYSDAAFAAKERFVEEVLAEFRPKQVLDVGANTGHFSARAAKAGSRVIAIDLDPLCVGAIWERARAEELDILPLVIDLSRPSPALGWRYGECASFLERATGSFDCVLMLAVVHHLLVSERIPLAEIFDLAAELTTSLLIVEFVGVEDEMFRELARGREELYESFNKRTLEAAFAPHFQIVRELALQGTERRLYALRRKGGGT